ncbi:hypothetical protein NEOC65_001168, partial [Neochlamydia sp. AcF65]|nr:hypothetical protein [Neochlamydia sp. AcF65]
MTRGWVTKTADPGSLTMTDDKPSVSSKKAKVPLVDCLMSGLALFGLKFPSLLKFDQRKEEPIIKHNLSTLYKI